MRDALTEKQIEIAVEWWANQMRNPTVDNDDSTGMSGLAGILSSSMVKDVSDEKIEKFKKALSNILEGSTNYSMGCDYNPCVPLADAMKSSGIPAENAPQKTNMLFWDKGVKVSEGYAAEWVTLLAPETK